MGGNADGEGRAGLTGVGYAAPVLFQVFSLLPDSEWFYPPYDEMTPVAVCRESGYKAAVDCPHPDTLWQCAAAQSRLDLCRFHRKVHLSSDGKWQVDASCYPVHALQTRSWFVLPPSMAYFYQRCHLDYIGLPDWLPGCEQAGAQRIQLIYPTPSLVMFPVRDMEGRQNPFVFRAAHADASADLFWHLDGAYLGQTSGPDHEMACLPAPGRHLLSVVDADGHRAQVTFTVK